MNTQREAMEVDVLIVGAGPAGLSAAIRLAQLSQDKPLTICVIEKGAEVGAHILSGAVLEPRALDELLPNWREMGAPIHTAVTKDELLYLSAGRAKKLPTPPAMRNQGNYIISLSELCRWLGQTAEKLDIEIYPGFAATEILFHENGAVKGVATGDMGIGKDGNPTSNHSRGMELHARTTLFTEGCRGSLTEVLCKRFDLRANRSPQTYAIGIKELWEVDNPLHTPGKVTHTIGWPLPHDTYGGSFLYHLDNKRLAIGLVIGLDYANPYLNPFAEMQRFKTHSAIAPYFENGTRLSYGARALNEGGFQSIPQLHFPGGLIAGCGAGFMNVAKIKGTHTAMKSGMLAAETIVRNLQESSYKLAEFDEQIEQSWITNELHEVRNLRPSFTWGLWPGLIYSAIDTYLLRGKAPWTFKHHPDHKALKPAAAYTPIHYPKPDGQLTFDKLSSVSLSNTHHEENQPVHLKLHNPQVAIETNLATFAAPETRYCPAGVYEIVDDESGSPRLQINAANCIHCKTCDIKDPTQNITWTPPEGSGGPNYNSM